MSYLLGLACAIAAMLVALLNFRGFGARGRWMIGLAFPAGALVFYTVLGSPGPGWIRTLDCFEVALAAAMPILAIIASGMLRRGLSFLVLPTVLLSAVFGLSLADAIGLTYGITGWNPGVGVAVAPGIFSDEPILFAAADYCST